MNTLRTHILQEVTQLDIPNLLALQSLLNALKKSSHTKPQTHQRGQAAARCRQILKDNNTIWTKDIAEEREERL